MKRRLIVAGVFFVFFLQFRSYPRSQTENSLVLAGFVTDEETHAAIVHVRVSALGDQGTAPTYTDSSGIFRITLSQNTKSGVPVHLIFEKQGYSTSDRYVAATPSIPLMVSMHREDKEKSAPGPSRHSIGPVVSPIEKLSELGWTIQPSDTDIQFEINNKPLPDMKESAVYFARLSKPFRLHLQQVPGIAGLHLLAGLAGSSSF
jgi:hypothetical protein